MAVSASDVISWLSDPEKLMRRCYVSVSGGDKHTGANGQAMLATFKVVVDNASTYKGFTTGRSGKAGKMKDRPKVYITKQPGPAITPPPKDHFNSYYIPMVTVADVGAGNSHYSLPTTGSVKNVITSQITACVFSVGSAADGSVLVSHVQPLAKSSGLSHADRQAGAVTAGATGMTGATQFRDGHDYNWQNDIVAILGHRKGKTWEFFSQKFSAFQDSMIVRSAAKFAEVSETVSLP